MSTRSFIGLKNEDGSVDRVYCHHDSYRNLQILRENYNTLEKVKELLSYGNMSGLEKTIADCEFYSRDCGEELEEVKANHFKNVKDFLIKSTEDYTFLFEDGKWKWRTWSNPLTAEDQNEK